MSLSVRRIALPASLTLSLSLAFPLGSGLLGGCSSADSGSPPATEPDAASAVDAGSDAVSEPDAAPPVDAGQRGTVAGKIISDSENVAGVKIVIGDKSATSDANGAYAIDDVTFPYTLAVIVPTDLTPAKRAPNVAMFPGLSSPNPVVEVNVRVTHAEANYAGKIQGGVANLSAGSRFRLIVLGAGTEDGIGQSSPGQTGDSGRPYSATLRWPSAQSTQAGHLVGLVYTHANGHDDFGTPGIPTTYNYASSTDVYGESGKTYTDPFFPPFAAANNKTVAGTIEVPSGYTVKWHYLRLASSADDKNSFSYSEAKTDTSFTYNVPDVALLDTVGISVTAADASGASSSASAVATPGTNDIKVILTKAPEVIAPADNAAGIKKGDVFSWKPAGDDCLYKAYVSSANDGAPSFAFTTTDTQFALPDLGAFGAELSVSTKYMWSVSCVHVDKPTKPSVDDAVKLGGVSSRSSATSASRTMLTL